MEKILTAKEAAKKLNINVFSIYKYAREGIIPAIKIGEKLVRFSEEDLSRWIEQQKQNIK